MRQADSFEPDINGYEKDMKRTASELDTLVEGWLEEHKRKRALNVNGEEDRDDFMDILPNVLQGTEISGYDSDTIIKATCLVRKCLAILFSRFLLPTIILACYPINIQLESKTNLGLPAINLIPYLRNHPYGSIFKPLQSYVCLTK
ncbi:hypothetical protein V8G54_035201 [Vigna mungo]|uniref:Uncharacterized protein n=1 Tax=Vigna mungo TaxID=3915 RepID=A0AAQ3MES6_VIGMU